MSSGARSRPPYRYRLRALRPNAEVKALSIVEEAGPGDAGGDREERRSFQGLPSATARPMTGTSGLPGRQIRAPDSGRTCSRALTAGRHALEAAIDQAGKTARRIHAREAVVAPSTVSGWFHDGQLPV